MPVSRIAAAVLCSFLAALASAEEPPKRNAGSPATEGKNGRNPEAAGEKPGKADGPIDFDKARELFRKRQSGGKLTADEEAYVRRAMEARRKAEGNAQGPQNSRAIYGKTTVGFKPLPEMSADDRYEDQDGGLYGEGRNEPPVAHRRTAEAELARIEPLDSSGKPSADGRIVFVSISMSNATQEFSMFKRIADQDPAKSAKLTIVDCAQGGQAMAEWVSPDAGPWREAERRIANAGVTAAQVQVAWVKLANKGPHGTLEEHGRKLQRDTQAVVQNARARFPNLRIAYLSSRIYGGYTSGALNPEPYAYESAFAARWLIQDQMRGSDALQYSGSKGEAKAPLLLWGPYLWADGTTARKSDGLTYSRDDLAGDGTHPSEAGRKKVAELMLRFYKTDPLAVSWFTGKRE